MELTRNQTLFIGLIGSLVLIAIGTILSVHAYMTAPGLPADMDMSFAEFITFGIVLLSIMIAKGLFVILLLWAGLRLFFYVVMNLPKEEEA